jgi:uncharacterized membrane protein
LGIVKNILKSLSVYLLLCVATFLMLKGILQYLPMQDDIGFLLLKKDYLNNRLWKTAFYVHVFTSIITLLAGFTQFSNDILRDHKRLHRVIGKIYVIAVLCINFPVGMIMAIYANGGICAKTAFVILDTLWFLFTLKAFLAIRKREIITHKKFMMRSYALTLSAVGLRSWQFIISHSIVIDPALLYKIDAWLGFVPNLIFVELLIYNRYGKKRKNTAKQVKHKPTAYL